MRAPLEAGREGVGFDDTLHGHIGREGGVRFSPVYPFVFFFPFFGDDDDDNDDDDEQGVSGSWGKDGRRKIPLFLF